jgi:hypothetical protein
MLAGVTTVQKGAIAELAIAHRAAALGIGVFKPLTDGERYDLIFDLRPRLIRVQCKWAQRSGAILLVRCYSCRRTRDGQVRRPYSTSEIDAFAPYCHETNECYLLPISDFPVRRGIHLRLGASLNNQRAKINWADHFEMAATLTRLKGP